MRCNRRYCAVSLISCPETALTNFPDVRHFLRFIAGFRDQTRPTIGEITFDIESAL